MHDLGFSWLATPQQATWPERLHNCIIGLQVWALHQLDACWNRHKYLQAALLLDAAGEAEASYCLGLEAMQPHA